MRILVLSIFTLLLVSCGWEKIDPGFEGVVMKKPFFFGHGGISDEPLEPGRVLTALSTKVIEYDLRPNKKKDNFNILMQDSKLNVSFGLYLVTRLNKGSTPSVLKTMGTPKNWFQRTIEPRYREIVRGVISTTKTNEVNNNRNILSKTILERTRAAAKQYPVEIISVSISNIDYPASVTKAVEIKMQRQQELKRQSYEVQIERKKAEKRVIEARGIARAQAIINTTLTQRYIQLEYVKSIRESALKGNQTIYIPTEANLPILEAARQK